MNILHLSTTDNQGGAARSTYRLHKALIDFDYNSKILVQYKTESDKTVDSILDTRFERVKAKIRIYNEHYIIHRNNPISNFSVSKWGINIFDNPTIKTADIIHLHWINGGFLSIKNVCDIREAGKPIIWTLHDMWAFTGGCHYSGDCEKYLSHCVKCPQLSSDKKKDLSYRIFRMKVKYFNNSDIVFVTPSEWMKSCVAKSALFNKNRVYHIPNGIDLQQYKPVDSAIARSLYNLPQDRKIIAFGAANAIEDKRKGFSYLLKSLLKISQSGKFKEKICLIVFGAGFSPELDNLPFKVVSLGTLHDNAALCLAYNAADVFVIPSLEDNLPNTVLESFACGTPVVGFNCGGIKEMIDHRTNGYLAMYKDENDFSEGIQWVLEMESGNGMLGRNAREKALNEYSIDRCAEQYSKLYKMLIDSAKQR